MSPEHAEQIGKLAERLDSALSSAKMPLPPQTHLAALTAIMRDVRNELAAIVREATGDDPWADNPMEG